MANNYTAVPHAYLEECEELSDAEFGRLMRALLRYSMTGEVMALSGNERFFARRAMNQEDVNAGRYALVSEKRAEAGRRGAMARWQAHRAIEAGSGGDGKHGGTETETEAEEETESEETRKDSERTKEA